jgi:hypothetical protein
MVANQQQGPRKRVLFYRDYQGFQGGHLKVWDYFQHLASSDRHQPLIYFSPNSSWDSSNPWSGCQADWLLETWDPDKVDLLFLAGLDWQHVPLSTQTPVINLIQHVRHGDAGDPRQEFLRRPALRICVSEDVRQAILSTGLVVGPVVTIPNGIDLPCLGSDALKIQDKVLISGMKNPAFATDLALRLGDHGIPTELILEKLSRPEFLKRVASFQCVVTLPHEREGFYLPALEAMGLGCLVICPDCLGNRDFCFNGVNSFRPNYRTDDIIQAVLQALRLAEADKQAILLAGQKTAHQHSLSRERETFYSFLADFERAQSSQLTGLCVDEPSKPAI